MITVEVLGSGCKKCRQLEANAKEAIETLNIEAEVIHVTDLETIVERGVTFTPALFIDGRAIEQGKVLTPGQIQTLLTR